MPIPTNKRELIIAIEESYSKLKADLGIIPADITIQKELDGHAKGTTMSICNLVSYLIGWGELVLKWHHKKEKDEPINFPETGYKWNELDKLAQKFYTDYEAFDYPALLQKLDKTVDEILDLINITPNAKLYE